MNAKDSPSFPPANLLLVSFDQWRGDWGDPLAPVLPLPALAGLASQGWTARRCCTSSPHCVPARLSWITGLAPSQLGITRNRDVDLPPDAPSLVRDLREAGWHTALVGKTHWSSHGRPRDLRDDLPRLRALGFEQAIEIAGPRALRRIDCALTDAWRRAGLLERQRADLLARYGAGRTPAAWAVRPTLLPAALYPDVWIADQARELLASLPADRPWLLWVSFVGPHEPFDTPPPWHGRHATADLPPPAPRPAWLEQLPQGCELRRSAGEWGTRLSPEAIAACRADYADHLRLLDDQLAALLAALQERPDAGRTAVLATADHGELLGDAGMLYKGAFLEGAVRVPWIYRPPGGTAACVSEIPLGLSELLERCLAGLPGGGGLAPLLAWARRRPGAVVEFGAERLFLRGPRKLAVDGEGRPLWAVHLGRDPLEQVEVIREAPRRWRWSPAWRRLRRWAAAETARRSGAGWLWRQLGAQG